jgi:hypothetical protein
VLFAVTQLSLHRLLGSKQAIELEFWKLKATINQSGDDSAPRHPDERARRRNRR